MESNNIEDVYELTPMQQGMLFYSLSSPDCAAYNIQMIFSLEGELDPIVLEKSWQLVVDRYTALRTSFVWEGVEKQYQVVLRKTVIHADRFDWQELGRAERDERLRSYIAEDLSLPFDLKQPPLARLSIITLGAKQHRLLWTFHHMILEGWSAAIVLADIWQFYNDLSSGRSAEPAPAKPFADYVSWLKQQDQNKAESYWRENLKNFESMPGLPIDKSGSQEMTAVLNVGIHRSKLSKELSDSLKSVARKSRVTVNTVIQGAWAILLARYTRENDVIFGAAVSGRPADLPSVEHMVGMFVNVLPVRIKIDPDSLLVPWLQAIQLEQAAMREYEYSSLMQVKSWSGQAGGSPLFESVLAFENWFGEIPSGQITESLKIGKLESNEMTDQPLTLLVEMGQVLAFTLKYDSGRFDKIDIEQMSKRFGVLLENIASGNEGRIFEFSMLEAAERKKLLTDWNDTFTDYSPEQCIHYLFEEQAARSPESVALDFEGQTLSYQELDSRSNQLAHYLRENGIGSGQLVGVFMDRSLEMFVALFGILKSGAAYVPMDPEYPGERLSFIMGDTQVPMLLTQQKLQSLLPESEATIICLDEQWDDITTRSSSRLEAGQSVDDTAYVIYTSGSTGTPKGVINCHRGIFNRLLWTQQKFCLGVTDRVLQKTPFCFDVSVWEIFWPLIVGASTVIAKPEGHRDPTYLSALIQEKNISIIHFVPSMLQAYLEHAKIAAATSLKWVICSGEALSTSLQQEFFQQSGCQLHNLYGPTEAAIDVTSWECQREDKSNVVPIGKPIANTQMYILDPSLQPVPVGLVGELHIGGVQLAQGYLNRPELTAEKFIPNPFSNDTADRLYKTGDLARYRQDGNIEYLGRTDYQVKLRGFRIELGEIESVLETNDAVQQAVVIVREDEPGNQQLIAYFSPVKGCVVSGADLRDYAQQQLPSYMIPQLVVELAVFPLTSNGKVNRKALPLPQSKLINNANESSEASGELESLMIDIWESVLDLEGVSPYETFFDLGGNSLLTLKVADRFEKKTGFKVIPSHLLTQSLRQVVAGIDARNSSVESGMEKKSIFGLFKRR